MTRPTPPLSMPRPRRLLTQNSGRKRIGVWNWTLPARLPNGRTIRTCPFAGVCTAVCNARNGTYNIPAVKARHLANLTFVLDDPTGWEHAMIAELDARRFRCAWVRIHDSGDFFSDTYLSAWLRIISACPKVNFYAYTKEVRRFRRLVEPDPPPNFRWVYSLGGSEDGDLDLEIDRVADVLPTEEAIEAAGWYSQEASDLLAVTGPAPVGIPTNNIPRFRRRRTIAPSVNGRPKPDATTADAPSTSTRPTRAEPTPSAVPAPRHAPNQALLQQAHGAATTAPVTASAHSGMTDPRAKRPPTRTPTVRCAALAPSLRRPTPALPAHAIATASTPMNWWSSHD